MMQTFVVRRACPCGRQVLRTPKWQAAEEEGSVRVGGAEVHVHGECLQWFSEERPSPSAQPPSAGPAMLRNLVSFPLAWLPPFLPFFTPPSRSNVARKVYWKVEQPMTTSLVGGSGDPLQVGGSPGHPAQKSPEPLVCSYSKSPLDGCGASLNEVLKETPGTAGSVYC